MQNKVTGQTLESEKLPSNESGQLQIAEPTSEGEELIQDYYSIKRWGEGYFDINPKGHVTVKANRQGSGGDLYELIQSLVQRGIEAPILVRFNGIIRDRISTLHRAFQAAIQECNYRGSYQMAFPIKVNPQRHVVEAVQQGGREFNIGLEVGSKPELIAVMAQENTPGTLLLCNGYKDSEYISLALMASKLGKRTLIIIEQVYELKLVLDAAEKLGIEALIGFRMKLANKGTGKWHSSGGENSKFGLFAHEIVFCLEQLRAKNKTHWLKLLHFHIGSQITSIESIKKSLHEGVRMYTELARDYSSLCYFDVGGGLAIDYDGSKSVADFSMNYTLEEYARNVVYVIGEACLEAGVADPIIITESGRGVVAHHSVLITEVIDITAAPLKIDKFDPPTQHAIILTLVGMYEELTVGNCRETFHDAMELKEMILEEFIYGKLSLIERAYAERVYSLLLLKIRQVFRQMPEPPQEIEILDQILLEIYFCNFSVFQSLPDSWAIGQLFPIMPIHRLHERPTHRSVLADLSCDSDGTIDSFIGQKGASSFLKLHDYREEPYYLGIFLTGAYQEILGGLHNLFGDPNVVHAELDEKGEWEFSSLVEGDTIEEVLNYVQYNPERMLNQLHALIERSLKTGELSPLESAQIKKKFKQALESYTYLVV
jgi:arginine decarboxylase